MFEVWGRDVPDDTRRFRFPEGSKVQHIGNIISKSSIVTSYFGDTRLFFEHEFMQQDFSLNPKFKLYLDKVTKGDIWGDTPIPYWPEDDNEEAEKWVKASLE